MGHDTVDGLPATMARSRRGVRARRVPADYRPSTRSRLRPGRSGARHHGVALAALLALALALALASSANAGQPGGDVTLEVISAWGGPVNTVHIEGSVAYIGSGLRLVTLDITDLSNITELGSINLLSTVQDLVVRDGYAFVVTWADRRSSCGAFVAGPFVTVDVSDPSNPVLVSTNNDVLASLSGNDQVELYGNIAFVLEARSEPDLYDISDPSNVAFMGRMPFTFDTFEIDGDLFYGADNGQLEIYDLSPDPLNPTLLGSATVDQQISRAWTLEVQEGYAYLTLRGLDGEFLVLFDVSNPRLPFIAGIYDEFPNDNVSYEHSYGLAVSGGLAYVATGLGGDAEGGLVILDVATDPANPTLVSTFDTHASVLGVRIYGTTAYLLDVGEGLVILDVSDPAKPVRLGGYYSPAYLRKMKKIGDLLYVSDAWNGFTVLDVSDPNSIPIVVGIYQTPNSPPALSTGNWGLDVRDGLAYLSEGGNGLEVVDVSDPQNPVSVGAVGVGGIAMDLKLNPVTEPPFTDILHVSTEPGAWLVNFDVSSPSNITEIGSAFLGGGQPYVYDIEVTPDGQYAHVARSLAVQVVDISDPTVPEVIHTTGVPNDVLDLALDGNVRYLASEDLSGCDNTGALHIQNISDPTNPTDLTIVDWCYPGGTVETPAVTVANGRAYVFGGFKPPGGPLNTGTLVYDISDPRAPILLGFAVRVGTPGSTAPDALLVDEPYLYLATSGIDAGQGLVLIKIQENNPADLDGDGSVGVKDLLILLGSWGPCADCKLPGDCPADLNDDCSVGVKDLLILLGNWG